MGIALNIHTIFFYLYLLCNNTFSNCIWRYILYVHKKICSLSFLIVTTTSTFFFFLALVLYASLIVLSRYFIIVLLLIYIHHRIALWEEIVFLGIYACQIIKIFLFIYEINQIFIRIIIIMYVGTMGLFIFIVYLLFMWCLCHIWFFFTVFSLCIHKIDNIWRMFFWFNRGLQ